MSIYQESTESPEEFGAGPVKSQKLLFEVSGELAIGDRDRGGAG
jgi:hypothetical protein